MDQEYINRIIEIGKKGECTSDELLYFLPNLPSLHGSEILFTLNKWKLPKNYRSIPYLVDMVKGLHLIEMSYKLFSKNDFGFGSPSKTEHLITYLETIDLTNAKELYNWVASNGGNYYIKSGVTYEENKKKK